MKKNILIKFVDMPSEFNCRENYITKALQKDYNIIFSDKPEFLFYGNFGTSFTTYLDAVKICITGEPVLPNFNDCDYAIDYHTLSYGDRHFRAGEIIGNVGKPVSPKIQDRSGALSSMTQRRFCNFVYFNENSGEGARLRTKFCRLLSRYKQVDCPGSVLHNIDVGLEDRYTRNLTGERRVADENWVITKLKFLQLYKFTIAFENTSLSGYTTEKLYHPFQAYSIPIYWGNPDVCEQFNPKAFINANDYGEDFEGLIEKVIELDTDDEKYLAMLREPPFRSDYVFDEEQRLAHFLAHIIEKGPHPYEKNALGFPNVSTMSFEQHCRLGHVGMRTIIKYGAGWLHYKIQGKG